MMEALGILAFVVWFGSGFVAALILLGLFWWQVGWWTREAYRAVRK